MRAGGCFGVAGRRSGDRILPLLAGDLTPKPRLRSRGHGDKTHSFFSSAEKNGGVGRNWWNDLPPRPLPYFPPSTEPPAHVFARAAQRIGWRLEAYPIAAVGPGGEELTIDGASSATEDADNVLVISSGLHGVEGFFGSAVQTMVLEQ